MSLSTGARPVTGSGPFGSGPVILEVDAGIPVPLYLHPGWARAFPWLIQGVTHRRAGEEFDLRLSGEAPIGRVLGRWRDLQRSLECYQVVHATQVHGRRIVQHDGRGPGGIMIAAEADGHLTLQEDILLTVSVADCVPISIIDPVRRAILLLHGGWRGIVAGILEEGVRTLAERAGSEPASLFLHLGPAICGACYEVGEEVHEALGLELPEGRATIDLRAILMIRAERLGLNPVRITRSKHCTRCGDSPFFSHRGGDEGRQVAVLGMRAGRGSVSTGESVSTGGDGW